MMQHEADVEQPVDDAPPKPPARRRSDGLLPTTDGAPTRSEWARDRGYDPKTRTYTNSTVVIVQPHEHASAYAD